MSRVLRLGAAAREIMRREGLARPPEVWRMRRLFEQRVLPEPARLANGYRVVDELSLPIIVAALAERGWLPERSQREAVAAVGERTIKPHGKVKV